MTLLHTRPQTRPVQGTYTCRFCGKTETKGGPNQKDCAECRQARDVAYHKARYNITVGSRRACSACGVEFVVESVGGRTICDPCRRPQTPICVECKSVFTRDSNRQKYCQACRNVRVCREKRAHYYKYKDAPGVRERKTARACRIISRKYREDPAFAINVRMRAAIISCLAKRKARKTSRWHALVGYALEELMLHIERQFTKGMSWDNRAKWHLDHIRPLSSFSFTSEHDQAFRDAWALSNLRPIWAKDNWAKSDARTHLL